MPAYRSHTVIEVARGVKAFFTLAAGVTRGGVPEPDALQGAIEAQTRKLAEARRQIERQNQHIQKLQSSLPDVGSRRATEPDESARIVEHFHKLYYNASSTSGTWKSTYWLGVPIWKCPLDMWIYQEIIFEQRPDIIIETGTAFGGSALFLACMCDLVGNGEIVTVDIEHREGRPQHDRIRYMQGSSTAEEIVKQVKQAANGGKVLVILDSDHSKDHVLEELHTYSGLVHTGGYVIVEDTNVNGHPVRPHFGLGPMEAVDEFIAASKDFAVDESKEKFYMTFNPRGFLKKIG